MLVLLPTAAENRPRPIIAIFGLGLIGSAVLEQLRAIGDWSEDDIPFSWSRPAQQKSQAQVLAKMLGHAGLRPAGAIAPFLHIVWAAGKAGFSADEATTAAEEDSFRVVLSLAEELEERHGSGSLCFHLLSSAGGLFEGETCVTRDTKPRATRPYGALKLKQEQLLEASGVQHQRVYRPTSVYDLLAPTKRRGLITTLVYNALRGQVTRIVGRPTTLRDFVSAQDVGAYITSAILRTLPAESPEPAILATAKPTSIHSVKETIESTLLRKVYIQYASSPSNEDDITFSAAALPRDWQPTDLETNIRCGRSTILSSGAAFALAETSK